VIGQAEAEFGPNTSTAPLSAQQSKGNKAERSETPQSEHKQRTFVKD
jgi:hypothetical protein